MGRQALQPDELVVEFGAGLRVSIRSVNRGDEHAINGCFEVAWLPVADVAWKVSARHNGSPSRENRHAVPAGLAAPCRVIARLADCLRRKSVSAALVSCRQTTSGSPSRSHVVRFVKRRLMLLMLKLAIRIDSGRRASASALGSGCAFGRSQSKARLGQSGHSIASRHRPYRQSGSCRFPQMRAVSEQRQETSPTPRRATVCRDECGHSTQLSPSAEDRFPCLSSVHTADL